MSNGPKYVSAAGEGLVDEAVIERIVRHVGGEVATVYGGDGKQKLDRDLSGYNQAARFAPWLVLRDLNADADCAPLLIPQLLPTPAAFICFRIAVRMVESWLLADRARAAEFLGVSSARIPIDPEGEADPKNVMVQIAQHSSRRLVRQGMIPRPSSGRSTGPAYTSLLIEYVRTRWRPQSAAKLAPSLAKALDCLRSILAVAP